VAPLVGCGAPLVTTLAVGTRPTALGRVAAVLALASAGVHLLLLDAGSLGSVVMVLMAAACLPCAWHLWRSPTGPVWRVTAMVDAAMLVLHAQLLGTPEHPMPGMPATSGLMWLGLGLVTAQLAAAALAAVRR
jgi:hypothetical protein